MVIGANIGNLRAAAGEMEALDRSSRDVHATLSAALSAFDGRVEFGAFESKALVDDLVAWVDLNARDPRYLRTVATVFEDTDQRLGRLPTNAEVAAALQAAGLSGARPDLDVDPAAVTGVPATSGYSDDPVNVASGNFFEVEDDLTNGPHLGGFGFRRTYNSRDERTGPFGPGWSSLASARLVLARSAFAAVWRGPDGQQARVPVTDARVPGTGGHVEVDPGQPGRPLRLVFPLDGVTWHFDRDGRPCRLDHGPGDHVVLTWQDDRLVGLRHARGAGLALRWDPAQARIVAVEADDGRRATYAYDDAGRLVAVDAPGGRRTYGWDEKDRLVTVSDADGVVEARNAYDRRGRVVRQVTPFGRVVRFWYRPGLVTEVDDAGGEHRNVWCHDEAGHLEQVTDGLGATMTTRWTGDGRPLAVTDRTGATVRHTYDGHGRPVRTDHGDGGWEERAWDDQHRLVAVATPAGTTRYAYDGDMDRLPATVTDPEGGVTRFEHGDDGLVLAVTDPDGARLAFTHDDRGRVRTATGPDGGVRRFDYDAHGRVAATTSPLGHVTRYERDPAGRVTARTDPGGGVWRTERSPAGRVVATVDPLGHRHETRYGPHGERVATLDPLGHRVRFDHDAQGRVVATTDPLGHTWRHEHDACQRPVATTDPLGHTWRQEFDAEGRTVATVTPGGRRQATPRDAAGRPLRVTATVAATELLPGGRDPSHHDPDRVPHETVLAAVFAGLPEDAEVEVAYDAAGRAASFRRADGSVVRVDHDGCGRVTALTRPSGATTRFAYTPGGRLASITGPTGATARYRYDRCGRLAEVVDAVGARTRLRHDADGRLVEVVGPTGERTRYAHDPGGRVVATTAPDGGVTRHDHDAAGRLVAITDPTGGVTRVDHDAAGRVVATTDANGATTTYEHDAAGRLVAVVDPLGARTTYGYDPCGRRTLVCDPLGRTTRHAYDADGRPVAITEPDGTVRSLAAPAPDDPGEATGDHDGLDRVRTVTTPEGDLLLRHEWDVDGNLVTEATPAATQHWAYDAAGHLVGHTLALAGQAPVTTGYTLDRCGRPVAVDDPSLGRVTIDRDPAGRPVRVLAAGLDERRTWRHGRLSAWERVQAADAFAVRYRRDLAGRVTRARRGDGTTTDYGYDPAGQLTLVGEGDRAWSFDWDPAGRLAAEQAPEGPRDYAYDAAGRLTSVREPAGTTLVRWDAAGRRTAEVGPGGERTYTWDAATGRLVSVGGHDLHYDLLGRLAAVDGTPLVWEAVDAVAVPRLVGVGDRRIAGAAAVPALVGPGAGDGIAWLPAVDDRHEVPGLDPWGRPGPGTPLPGPGPSGHPGLGFGHRQELSVDGLVWLRARAYDPATRSFLSPDPLPPVPGAPWAHNTYHYAANDPVNFGDPLGLQALSDEALAGIREGWSKNWLQRNWTYVVGGLMIVGGVALMFTGVGGPAGVALLLASGALIGGGASMVTQQAFTGEVDWTSVGRDALIGLATAGTSGLVAKGLTMTTLPTAGRVAVTAGAEGVLNVAAGAGTRVLDGGAVFDPRDIAVDAGLGIVIGGGASAAAARNAARRAAAASVTPTPTTAPVDLPVVAGPSDDLDDLVPTGVSRPAGPAVATDSPTVATVATDTTTTVAHATGEGSARPAGGVDGAPPRETGTTPADGDPAADPATIVVDEAAGRPRDTADVDPAGADPVTGEPAVAEPTGAEPGAIADPSGTTEPDAGVVPSRTAEPDGADAPTATDPADAPDDSPVTGDRPGDGPTEPAGDRSDPAEPGHQGEDDPFGRGRHIPDDPTTAVPDIRTVTLDRRTREAIAESRRLKSELARLKVELEEEVRLLHYEERGPRSLEIIEAMSDRLTQHRELMLRDPSFDLATALDSKALRAMRRTPVSLDESLHGAVMRDEFPERFVMTSGDDEVLVAAVEAAGVGNPAGWIDAVNPHANARPGGRAHPWNTNCADCVRTYVTTRQGGPAIAASGDLDVNRGGDLMDDWLGVIPGESLRSDGILDLDTFPDRAWQYVADALDGQPPDTVAVVTVAWEPIGIRGDTVLPGGHVFVAEVDAQNQLRWADPQTGDYRDWPPVYPQRPIAIEFVYREKLDDPWRPGPPPR